VAAETAGQEVGRTRDAERSKEAILGAAEDLFTEHGFGGVSLGEIAAAAGLSRGTPSYFFGSKARLYEAVLERVFRDREEATRLACRPLVAWAESDRGTAIRGPLAQAVRGYLEFLLHRPAFLRLVQREELAGAARLQRVPRGAAAIQEAFAAVRAVAGERGLKSFDVDDAVFLFVSLTFFPLAHRATFMAALERDPGDQAVLKRQIRLAVDQLLFLLGAER
jgi:AcrR family transcriptional regulator